MKQQFSDPYRLSPDVESRLVDGRYTGRPLLRALLAKIGRRLTGRRRGVEPVALDNGLLVFDAPGLGEGGLEYGQNYLRALLQAGIAPCERVLDLCAGPGYIGFHLLANGFCRTLALAELDPVACAVARQTVAHNGIGALVDVYQSDGLDGIPDSEQFDLVVCNGPTGECDQAIAHNNDPEWGLRRRVYGSIKRLLRSGGYCVFSEFRCDSRLEDFAPMIRAGGGEVIGVIGATDLRGNDIANYYIVSRF